MNYQQFPDTPGNDNGQSTYEYVFSNETPPQKPPHQAPKKKKGSHFLLSLMAIMLSVVLCLASGVAGAYLYMEYRAEGQANGIVAAPDPDQVHRNDAAEMLNKDLSSPSIFGSAGDEVFAVSQVANAVLDSVVVIHAEVTSSSMFGQTTTDVSTGSGVIIHSDGYILTCHHVISGANHVTVTLNSGTKYAATLVGSDASSDLAVLKIAPQEALVVAQQGCSADLVLGEQVVAIGNPLGTLYRTVTTGVVSGLERQITTGDGTTMTLLQTDAAVNSGNSGGGLFNLDGKLIGIVNAKYAEEGVEGLAFAIPIDWAYEVQLDLIQYGYVRGIADHGLETLDVNASNIQKYHYYYGIDTVGVYVVESAYCADLQNKDRIVSINGTAITTTAQMDALVDQYKVGDTLTIVASRDGSEFTTTLTLREYVPENAPLQ